MGKLIAIITDWLILATVPIIMFFLNILLKMYEIMIIPFNKMEKPYKNKKWYEK